MAKQTQESPLAGYYSRIDGTPAPPAGYFPVDEQEPAPPPGYAPVNDDPVARYVMTSHGLYDTRDNVIVPSEAEQLKLPEDTIGDRAMMGLRHGISGREFARALASPYKTIDAKLTEMGIPDVTVPGLPSRAEIAGVLDIPAETALGSAMEAGRRFKEGAQKVTRGNVAEGGLEFATGVPLAVLGPVMAATPLGLGLVGGQKALSAVAPKAGEYVSKVMTPIESLAKPRGGVGQYAAELGDLAFQTLVFAGISNATATRAAERVKAGGDLTPGEKNIIRQTDPEAAAKLEGLQPSPPTPLPPGEGGQINVPVPGDVQKLPPLDAATGDVQKLPPLDAATGEPAAVSWIAEKPDVESAGVSPTREVVSQEKGFVSADAEPPPPPGYLPVQRETVPGLGTVYDEYRGKPADAVEHLLNVREGLVPGALRHPATGPIDLVWGEAGTKKSNGYGLAKIEKYHPEVLSDLQGTIDGMNVKGASGNRVVLESPTHRAIVRLEWEGKTRRWLLSAFEMEKPRSAEGRTDGPSSLPGQGGETSPSPERGSRDNIGGGYENSNWQAEEPVHRLQKLFDLAREYQAAGRDYTDLLNAIEHGNEIPEYTNEGPRKWAEISREIDEAGIADGGRGGLQKVWRMVAPREADNPLDRMDRFFSETYPQLPKGMQTHLDGLVGRITGFRPGMVMGVENGKAVRVKDWQQVREMMQQRMLDAPFDTDHEAAPAGTRLMEEMSRAEDYLREEAAKRSAQAAKAPRTPWDLYAEAKRRLAGALSTRDRKIQEGIVRQLERQHPEYKTMNPKGKGPGEIDLNKAIPKGGTPDDNYKGMLSAGMNPHAVADAFGIKLGADAFRAYAGRIGKMFGQDNVRDLVGPFGQKFFGPVTPRGEMLREIRLPFVDPTAPVEREVNTIPLAMATIAKGASPSKIFGLIFDHPDARVANNNPINDFMESIVSAHGNQQRIEQYVGKLFKDNGIKSAAEDIRRTYGDLRKQMKELYGKLDETYDQTGEVKWKTILTGKNQENADLQRQIELRWDQMDQVTKELAEKHPSVRISLAAEDKLPSGISLSPNERNVVAGIKELMTMIREAMVQVGMPVLKNAYVPHMLSVEDFARGTVKLYDRFNVPQELLFQHRDGIVSWMPDIVEQMTEYPARVTKKIGLNPSLQKWTPFFESEQVTPEIRRYFERWVNDMVLGHPDMDWFNRALTVEQQIESFRLLALKASPGVKHLVKLRAALANAPIPTATEAMVRTIGGVLNKALGNRLLAGRESMYQQMAHEFIADRQMMQIFNEVPGDVATNMWNALSRYTNTVRPVEVFENAFTMLSNVAQQRHAKLNAIQLRQAMWEALLRINFRSGADRPRFMVSTGARSATQFQGTPFKQFEQNAELIYKALNKRTDAFGDPYMMKTWRMMYITGLVEAMAHHYGYSIVPIALHLPFVQAGTGPLEPTREDGKWVKWDAQHMKVSLPPTIGLINDMADKGILQGLQAHYAGLGLNPDEGGQAYGGGMPAFIMRGIVRPSERPDIYDNVWEYWAGMPKVEKLDWKAQQQEAKEQRQHWMQRRLHGW